MKAKLWSIEVAYTTLKDKTQDISLELPFREKKRLRPPTNRWFP